MTAKIKLNAASGGGSVSLQAPSSSSNNRVFTIPDVADGTIATTATAGKILQVVSAFSNTHLSSSSTSYVDLSGVTATITPASSSNKILIICSIALSKADNHSFLGRIVRNGSAISGAGGVGISGNGNHEDGVWWNIRTTIYSANPSTVNYLDSPSTTSAVTYKAQGKTSGSSAGFSLNRTGQGDNDLYNSPGFSQITLMEIAA
jgi:hypothetical protein